MKIVEERRVDGANLILPAPTIVLAIEREGGFDGRTAETLAGAVGSVNKALAPLDNPFLPVSVELRPDGLSPAQAAAEFVARMAIALQRQYLSGVSRFRWLGAPDGTRVRLAYEFRNPVLALLSGRTAVGICSLLLDGDSGTTESLRLLVDAFKERADKAAPNYDTRLLLREAERRGIPWRRAIELIPVIDLGQGARRRRFRNSMGEGTSDTAYRLSSFKPLAARLLEQHGVPVPPRGVADSADQAVAIAQRLGYPVVVKPVGQDKGVGVRTGIVSEADLRDAYKIASAFGPVQVETHLPGFDHRFTFIRGVLVGVLRTTPPIIVGDGRSTVRALLEAEPKKTATLSQRKIIVDEEVIGRIGAAGFALDGVLPPGRSVVLRKWWRSKLDHMLENVTDITHPENVEVALRAVRLIGLDVAGVDYITEDISRPWHRTGGAFTEVNPMPALAGAQRCGMPAYEMLFDAFFPDGDDARIPTALVLGSGGGDVAARLLARMLARAGHAVGLALRSRVEVAGRPIRLELEGERARTRAALFDPLSTAAVLECSPDAIDKEGLAFDLCDVAIVASGQAEDNPASSDAIRSDAAALVAALARKAVVAIASDPAAPALARAAGETPVFWVRAAGRGGIEVAVRPHDPVVSADADDEKVVVSIFSPSGTEALARVVCASPNWPANDPASHAAFLVAVAAGHALGLAADTMGETLGEFIENERAVQPGANLDR